MTPYEVLCIKRDASAEEIKEAYRRLAKKYHPDVSGGDKAQFQAISVAYEILSDPKRRAAYDAQESKGMRQAASLGYDAGRRAGKEILATSKGMRQAASLGYDAGRRAGKEILATKTGKRIAGMAQALGIDDVPGALAQGGATAGAALYIWLRSKADARRG